MDQNIEKKKKKWVLPVVIIVVVVALLAGAIGLLITHKGGTNDEYDFYSDSVVIDGNNNSGMTNYYAGIVEAQETQEIQKDASKEVDEIFVQVGDEVAKGDALFSYKTDELKLEIEKAKLSLENSATSITEYNNQITSLQNQINGTNDNTLKTELQLKITDTQNMIRQVQLEQRTTQAEIEAKQKSIENAIVKANMDGVVKTLSLNSTDQGPYMTILGTGTYRVKGSVDEMNVRMLSEGMTVSVHSRVDQSKTWDGTISKIDTESVNKDTNNNDYYGGGGSGESSTKYTFYVDLGNVDGLLLGQHVYIEPIFDYGDTEYTEEDVVVEDDAMVEESEATEEETTEE